MPGSGAAQFTVTSTPKPPSHFRVEIGFGIGFDSTGQRIRQDALELRLAIICRSACNIFGGYTLLETVGGWKNSAGEVVEEPGRTLLIFTDGEKLTRVEELARHVKHIMEQEAVALSVLAVRFQFV